MVVAQRHDNEENLKNATTLHTIEHLDPVLPYACASGPQDDLEEG